MSKEQRAVRDGTRSYKGSFQNQNSNQGKRQQRGETCPANRQPRPRPASPKK